MSAVRGHDNAWQAAGSPLATGALTRPLVFGPAGDITLGTFLAQARGVAACLPSGAHAINLCEDRYRFLVALCAAAMRGQVTLLPASRAPEAVADVQRAHAHSYCIGDGPAPAGAAAPGLWRLPDPLPALEGPVPDMDDAVVAAIGFTSGSTGTPTANRKTWGGFRAGTAQNLAALRDLWPIDAIAHVVATVPPQHMYGMELSVLLPLLGPVAVHAGRPFFAPDVALALQQCSGHRLLVTTPVHLRALVESGVALPALRGIVSATAPLSQALAAAAEQRFGCEVRELFGSTETCVIARRRTARDSAWSVLPGVSLSPQPDGTLVSAPHLQAPVRLADLVEIHADGRFELRGRNADLLEIAGKRASLGDLTRRVQAVAGVQDAVVFQLDEDHRGVRRIAALVVAPQMHEAQVMDALRREIDPVFLPRPIKCVDALPRNDTGKLPRQALLALLRNNNG